MSHIPNKGQVLQRYYGWYASRVRGMRRKATEAGEEHPSVCVDPEPEALSQAGRRWAKLLRKILEVEPLACPRCGQTLLALSAVALVACYLPARRATRTNPMEVLRTE